MRKLSRVGAIVLMVVVSVAVSSPAWAASNGGGKTSTSTSTSPNLLVGGGGTTYTYTTTDSVTPYSNHACWESSYELARFGPVNYCTASGSNVITDYVTGALCAVSLYLQVVNSEEFTTNSDTVAGWVNCTITAIAITFQDLGAATVSPAGVHK